ncbi:hypothetical protein F5Y16DRAFT_386247 [Xylariaceae sp. FL0255]|nr:hypothetical protein F5Y16DRAFT_386247 [Xylariaceae sp. FL0255]
MQFTQSLIVFLSALAVTNAKPPARKPCTTTSATRPTSTLTESVTYVIPSNGGSTPLASPPANSTLQHIAVGQGIQNYTCTTAGALGTSKGALAILYDMTALYPGSGASALSEADFEAFPARVLNTTAQPTFDASNLDNPFPADAALKVPGLATPLQVVGHHYFDSALVPTFDLSPELFKGVKTTDIPAPADADKGLTGEGAVDWLALSSNGASITIDMVYRIFTAGGVSSACTTVGDIQSVPYTAMYWIYV